MSVLLPVYRSRCFGIVFISFCVVIVLCDLTEDVSVLVLLGVWNSFMYSMLFVYKLLHDLCCEKCNKCFVKFSHEIPE